MQYPYVEGMFIHDNNNIFVVTFLLISFSAKYPVRLSTAFYGRTVYKELF